MERDREAPFLPHPSKARCPTASAGDGEATAQGRPNLSTSLSFVPGFPPAAHAGAVCLLSAARRAARTRQLGSCCMPRAPCPAPHTLGVAANGTPGAESPTWDQQRHPVAGSEGAGVVGHPSPLVLRGNGGSTLTAAAWPKVSIQESHHPAMVFTPQRGRRAGRTQLYHPALHANHVSCSPRGQNDPSCIYLFSKIQKWVYGHSALTAPSPSLLCGHLSTPISEMESCNRAEPCLLTTSHPSRENHPPTCWKSSSAHCCCSRRPKGAKDIKIKKKLFRLRKVRLPSKLFLLEHCTQNTWGFSILSSTHALCSVLVGHVHRNPGLQEAKAGFRTQPPPWRRLSESIPSSYSCAIILSCFTKV